MQAYFGERVLMSRAHHNCLMTKHPLYGSLTGWHRDIRFWSFEREDLVSVWLALGDETVDNGRCGSYRVLTGSRLTPIASTKGNFFASIARTMPRFSVLPSHPASRRAIACCSIAIPCTRPARISPMP